MNLFPLPTLSTGVCFFATDIHSGSLGKGGSDTIERVKRGDLGDTEMVMIFGKQDNHVPAEVCLIVFFYFLI